MQHCNFVATKNKLVRGYVNWALSIKKLRPDTIKVYLADLKLAHKIRDKKIEFENDFFVNAMLKGAKNISLYAELGNTSRFAMSFPLLKLIGHEIAISTVIGTQITKRSFGQLAAQHFLVHSDLGKSFLGQKEPNPKLSHGIGYISRQKIQQ
jgi:hypothetical protein